MKIQLDKSKKLLLYRQIEAQIASGEISAAYDVMVIKDNP